MTKGPGGSYFVAYAPGTFSGTPTVLVQPLGANGPNEALAYLDSETVIGFSVETRFAGVSHDRPFKFISVGPQ